MGQARAQSPWLYRDSILMYICCKEKPFGFEPLMRKIYILSSLETLCGVSLGQGLGHIG